MAKVLAVIAAILSGGALAVSVAAFARDQSPGDTVARSRIAQLERTVTLLQARAERQGEFDGEKLALRVKRILACLPEIQGEINGLTPEVDTGSVYLSNTQQISTYCSPILYGRPTGD